MSFAHLFQKVFSLCFVLNCFHLAAFWGNFDRSNNLSNDDSETECDYHRILKDLNDEITFRYNIQAKSSFNYDINMTKPNEDLKNKIMFENAKYFKELAISIQNIQLDKVHNANIKRQLKKLTNTEYAILPETDFKNITQALSVMENNFSKIKVCSYQDSKQCNLTLDPEVEDILAKSRNPEELKHYWTEFYSKFASMRKYFTTYVELNTKAAKLKNFTSGAEVWLNEYEDPNFENELKTIFEKFKPFYDQLHGYVRWRLRQKYGKDHVSETGAIPMHLLGNMWGETWTHIEDIAIPFPNEKQIDVTKEMVQQNYTPLKMFQLGDQFFQSLGLIKLPEVFWKKSVIEKPKNREIKCHAQAIDFYLDDDVRISMCAQVNMKNFITIHHELGHIQYYLQYQKLPFVYREGANPGFHEAVGDALALAVVTPKHLKRIKLLKDYEPSHGEKINRLFLKALDMVVFLPFAYTIDLYRWAVFRGQIKSEEYNCAFWKLRNKYSGVKPPVQRTEKDFDPAAKNHISEDVEYLRYLVADIVEFQFYKAMCEKADQYKSGDEKRPLNDCDFYGNKKAGSALQAMLSMGASQKWPNAMEILTGQRKMSIEPLMEYFEPLRKWLEKTNKENNVTIGWDESRMCE